MRKLILCIIVLVFGVYGYSQNSNQFFAAWELEKISYKKITAPREGQEERFLNVFKAGLYKKLSAEQRLDVYELEHLNEKAAALVQLFYQSQIEFQANGAFYNRSEMLEQTTSGEYLLDGKKLLMEWETADKSTFKILKFNASELVLKDVDLKISFCYTKTKDSTF